MTLDVVIIADTHLPKRAQALPEVLWRAIERADVVFHAGDWVDSDTLDALQARARRMVGVWGNNDGPELRERLPEVARVELDGVRFAMTHETGQKAGRERRMDTLFPDTDVLVFGHSHIPWDTTTPAGLRLLNPGSPTDRRRQPRVTYLTVRVDAGQLTRAELRDARTGDLVPDADGAD
ncbi:metallophosphoesterase family protein [Pseudoclavibacter sp. VKM Ac-2888]|uniref:metallophosphoesterase family protein n=1 Tax=Pseudoclavibacter sp. VKM Ac-2888 TaxID=2783830 RepID=UPI00188D8D68|nr:metallophosphoesterase [Pseudoclavibacter sp. VKM Ac-2888]MBF4551912.1 metallophosphoesterase [Pseudoclavibacter sp. VKM Ac-2888]